MGPPSYPVRQPPLSPSIPSGHTLCLVTSSAILGAPATDRDGRGAVLSELALALAGETDRLAILEGLAGGARRLVEMDAVVVASLSGSGASLLVDRAEGLELQPGSVLPSTTATRALAEERVLSLPERAELGSMAASGPGIVVPILRQGQALGVLIAIRTVGGARFTPDETRLLETLTGHVAVALLHAETLAEATRRLARVDQLAAALRTIGETQTRDEVVERALDCALDFLGADRAAIYVLQKGGGNTIALAAARGLSRAYLHDVTTALPGPARVLTLTHAPVHVHDAITDHRLREARDLMQQEGVRGILLVPLLDRGVLMGALGLYHDVPWTYPPDDLASIRAVGEQTALALRKADLFDRTSTQLAQLRAFGALARALAHPSTARERCAQAARVLVDAEGTVAQEVTIWELVGGRPVLVATAGHSTQGQAALDVAQLALLDRRATRRVVGRATITAAPIAHEGIPLGVLAIVEERVETAPSAGTTRILHDVDEGKDTGEFVATAAAQLGHALFGARLLEEATTRSAQLAVAIRSLPDPVLVWDREDRIVHFNQGVLEVYGLEGCDLTGWTAQDFQRETAAAFEDPSVAAEIVRRVAVDRTVRHRIEFVIVRPKRRVIERMSAPVFAPDGGWLGQVVLYHDLTEVRERSSR